MEKPRIVNYIEMNGEDVLMDSLPEEKRRKVAGIMQDNAMIPAGFKRKTA